MGGDDRPGQGPLYLAKRASWEPGVGSRVRHRRRRPSSREWESSPPWYRPIRSRRLGGWCREADIHFPAGGNDSVGVEAAVGPQGGPAVAHPPHRLTQEVGGATGGVGPALAQPGHQHLAGAGGNGQQRVIAAGAGIAVVARSLLGQSIGLADGRVQVDGQGRVAGSGPSGPGGGALISAKHIRRRRPLPTRCFVASLLSMSPRPSFRVW